MFQRLSKYRSCSASNVCITSAFKQQNREIHSKVAIVGGGTAGVSCAAQLVKKNMAYAQDITVFDPSRLHWYQPGFTMVSGGVLGNSDSAIEKVESGLLHRPMEQMFAPSVNLIHDTITSYSPENNTIHTSKGTSYTYDYLIICNGNELRFDLIEGLEDALNDELHPVGSMYNFKYAKKMNRIRHEFKGGRAICTQPAMPIKCAGAPQKFLYLAESSWRKNQIRHNTDVHFYTALPGMFGVPKYNQALKNIVSKKDIQTHHNMELVKIDASQKMAYFKNNNTGNDKDDGDSNNKNVERELISTSYDFLHVVPPQTANRFVKESSLSDKAGYVDINKETLQSIHFDNVFSVGDASNAPTSKTAAAVFSQTPILMHNLELVMNGYNKDELNAKYNGYTSCPIFVGDGKLLLAEFLYDGVPSETFPFDQSSPKRSFFYLKRYLYVM